jgi:hypothetical protein
MVEGFPSLRIYPSTIESSFDGSPPRERRSQGGTQYPLSSATRLAWKRGLPNSSASTASRFM